MKQQTSPLRIFTLSGKILFTTLLLTPQVSYARFQSEDYEIEDYVVDSGGGVAEFGDGSNHASFGQTRDDVNSSEGFHLLSGYLPYDDDSPVFVSLEPGAIPEPANSIESTTNFFIGVLDGVVSNPDDFRLQSGLNLIRVGYKASQSGQPNTWGYSDLNGGWQELEDGFGLGAWADVGGIVSVLNDCSLLVSCVTETDSSPDGTSYRRAPDFETIFVKIDFTNDPNAPQLDESEGEDAVVLEPTVVYKVVDMAGNVAFSESIGGNPWLKTEGGSVHSNRKIIQFNVPDGEPTVAYVLSAADTIVNVQSEQNWQLNNFPAYLEALEWPGLNYQLLVDQAEAEFQKEDKNGSRITVSGLLEENTLNQFSDEAFDPYQVYYREGDLFLRSNTYQGVENQRASTIIVEGNLYIEEDVVLREGGYLAFLVRGDIIVSGSVGRMDGTYIADYSEGEGGGIIDTGEDLFNPTQLEVRGQLIARAGFRFRRLYSGRGNTEPAEYVIYDPQVLLNTPPGLKSLPSVGAWEEVVPE